MTAAKRMVVSANNIKVPKAIPPPRGRLVKNADKRRKSWYKRGPTAKKPRSYYCFLWDLEGHLAAGFTLRQMFNDDS